ncbi:Unknown protein, partial [Striga hermonthica]
QNLPRPPLLKWQPSIVEQQGAPLSDKGPVQSPSSIAERFNFRQPASSPRVRTSGNHFRRPLVRSASSSIRERSHRVLFVGVAARVPFEFSKSVRSIRFSDNSYIPEDGNLLKPPRLLLFRIIAIIFFCSLNRLVGFKVLFIHRF